MTDTPWIGALIILLALTLEASGGAGYNVLEGKVVDENGRAQANVPVYLELPKGPIVAFTDERGVFQFSNLRSGEYSVFVKGGSRVSVRYRESRQSPVQTMQEPLVLSGR
jgi:hypothetical protein